MHKNRWGLGIWISSIILLLHLLSFESSCFLIHFFCVEIRSRAFLEHESCIRDVWFSCFYIIKFVVFQEMCYGMPGSWDHIFTNFCLKWLSSNWNATTILDFNKFNGNWKLKPSLSLQKVYKCHVKAHLGNPCQNLRRNSAVNNPREALINIPKVFQRIS